MTTSSEPLVRTARDTDVPAVCRFGAEHIPPHYAPLIGPEAADKQVRLWWNETRIREAVDAGVLVVAETGGELVGVGQRGRAGTDHVVYKLYVHPRYRGHGLGPRLLDALVEQLPPEADRICVEHFRANERAGSFYERAGFTVDRIEPSPSGEPALDVVWRSRPLTASDEDARPA